MWTDLNHHHQSDVKQRTERRWRSRPDLTSALQTAERGDVCGDEDHVPLRLCLLSQCLFVWQEDVKLHCRSTVTKTNSGLLDCFFLSVSR